MIKGGEIMAEKNEPLKYSVPDAHLGIILEEAPLFAADATGS